MSIETRVHELAALVADLLESNAALYARLAQLETQGRTEPAAPPQVNVNVPQQPAPLVEVAAPSVTVQPVVNLPAGEYVITHEWEGGRIVRSVVTRKG